MNRSEVLRFGAVVAAVTLLWLPWAPASAATVPVPVGTKVGLKFLTPVDSEKITPGTKVQFKVISDVIVDRHVVIRGGTPVTGTVTKVTKPSVFGADSTVLIGFLAAKAVDGKPVQLKDVTISKKLINKNRAGAAGASVGGAIILGPVGLLAGALVRGGYVQVPAGTVVTDTIEAQANVLTK